MILVNDLKKIISWTNYNRLSINYTKSKFQIFGNKSKLVNIQNENEILIGSKRLERVDHFSYLGDDYGLRQICTQVIFLVNFAKGSDH